MASTPGSWRNLYRDLTKHSNSLKRLALFEELRRLMQQRLIELSLRDDSQPLEAESERIEIENALRRVWQIEHEIRDSRQ